MPQRPIPTNGENVNARLFLRFFLCYLLATPIAILLSIRGVLDITIEKAGMMEFLFIPLALLGALLTVTKPYLLILSFLKSFYDMAILCLVTRWTQAGLIGILPWNACFFLLIFSLLLFTMAASRAALFSFLHRERDTQLVFSRPFGRYFFEAILFMALALSIYYLWPQICEAFGMITIPY